TLRLYREPDRAAQEIPVLRMLTTPDAELNARATRLSDLIQAPVAPFAQVQIVRAAGRVGGGALPLLELDGPAVSVRPKDGGIAQLRASLQAHKPPIVARAHEDALLLDPRTLQDGELEIVAAGVRDGLPPQLDD